jgi:hypothetical protein
MADRRATRRIRNDIAQLLENAVPAHAGLGQNRMKQDD